MDAAKPANAATLELLLQQRRSIRIFDGTIVPDAVVKHCLELALLSPSSSNLQPWQFYRIRKNLEPARLCFLKQTAVMTCSEIIVAVARPDLWRDTNDKILMHLASKNPPHKEYLKNYHGRVTPFFHDTGAFGLRGALRAAVNWAMGLKIPVARLGFFPSRLREVAVKSTALACQTFMLALTAHGYDSCPLEGFDPVRLKKLLQLPPRAVPVMGIAIGRRSPNYVPPERLRQSYADKILDY